MDSESPRNKGREKISHCLDLKNPQLKCLNHWWEREWKHFLSGVQCLRLHPVAVIHVCCQTISSIVRSDPENESEIRWKSYKNYPESFLSQTKTWNRGLFPKKCNLAFCFLSLWHDWDNETNHMRVNPCRNTMLSLDYRKAYIDIDRYIY